MVNGQSVYCKENYQKRKKREKGELPPLQYYDGADKALKAAGF